MITSAINYIKKKQNKKTNRENRRTHGKSKCIPTKSHTEAYTYTLAKREKEKNIYIVAPKVHHLNFGMICCLFTYSTDAAYIKLIVGI